MKKALALLCLSVFVLSLPFGAFAEGLFPSFSSIFVVEMPSFRAVAQREPDATEKLADGSTVVKFLNVSAAEFDAFSVYIFNYGCTLSHYTNENGVFTAEVAYKDLFFSFSYNNAAKEAVIIYPDGSAEETVALSADTAEPAPAPEPEPAPQHEPEPAPEPEPEPETSGVSLVIPVNSLVIWKKVNAQKISFSFDIQNAHPTKKVKSYEVAYYTCDEHNSQNSAVKTATLKQNIAPGEAVKSIEIYPTSNAANDIHFVYVAITGVHYADGTDEYESNPTYKFWILQSF